MATADGILLTSIVFRVVLSGTARANLFVLYQWHNAVIYQW